MFCTMDHDGYIAPMRWFTDVNKWTDEWCNISKSRVFFQISIRWIISIIFPHRYHTHDIYYVYLCMAAWLWWHIYSLNHMASQPDLNGHGFTTHQTQSAKNLLACRIEPPTWLLGNYLSIPKIQWHTRWSLGMDKWFHPRHHDECNYLSMPGLTC